MNKNIFFFGFFLILLIGIVQADDTTPPNLNLTYPLNNTIYNINVSFINYTVTDETGLSLCWHTIGNGTNSSTVTAGVNFTNIISTEGNNTWTVYCNDTSNNINSSTVTFTKDTIPPLITIISPQNATYNQTTVDFNVSLNENGSWCAFNLDGAGFRAANKMTKYNLTYFNFTKIGLAKTDHNIAFRCNDTANNMNSSTQTIYFKIDTSYTGGCTQPPNILVGYPADNFSTTTTTIIFTYNVTVPLSCIILECGLILDSIQVFTNNTPIQNPNNFSYSPNNGNHTWQISCSSQAGTSTSVPWKLVILSPDTGIGRGSSGVNIVNPDINTSIPIMPTEEKVKIAGLTIKNAIYWAGVFINWILIQISPNHPFELGLPVIIFSILGIAYLISTYKKKSKKKEEIYYEYQE